MLTISKHEQASLFLSQPVRACVLQKIWSLSSPHELPKMKMCEDTNSKFPHQGQGR